LVRVGIAPAKLLSIEHELLEAEGFDEALPVLDFQPRRKADPSVLEIDEVGLVAVREFRRYWGTQVAMLPDIAEFLVL
jgi:hypothetical protein